jgi:hypothetical protein
MDRPPLNRSELARMHGAADRVVGGGNAAFWPDPLGGTTVDLTPETYLARLTGQKIGAAYGWERVYASADLAGRISITVWPSDMTEANGGTPTSLPAIEPNGDTGLAPGAIVFIRPVDAPGVKQYTIVAGSGVGGSFPYPYSYGTVIKDGVVIPVYRYRCSGSNLEEQVEWWLIQASGITATIFDYNPNEHDPERSYWWCVGGDCVQSTSAPEGYNGGPYSSQAQCADNCI